MKLYVVQSGDSVAGIAGKHHMSVPEFRALNDGILDEKLVQGMKVRVSAAAQPLKVQRSEKIKQQAPEAAAPVTEVKVPEVKAPEVKMPKPQIPNPQPAAAETKQPALQEPAPQEKAGEYNTIFYPAVSTLPNLAGAAKPPQPQPYGAQFHSPAASAPQWPAPGYSPAPAMHPTQTINPYANYSGHPAAPAKVNYPNNPGFYAPSGFTPMPPAQHYFPQAPVHVNPYPAYSPAQMAPAAAVNHPPAAVSPAQAPVSGAAAANPAPAAPVSPAATGKTGKKNESAVKPAKKASYPFLPAGSIHLNAPVGAQGNAPAAPVSPWPQSATSPAANVPVKPAANAPVKPANKAAAMPGMKPAANKGSAVAPENIGGYPQPFIPEKQAGKPCGCGGPAPYSYPYSPFGTSPQIGYYGGNRPPEEIPYSALSPATPPIYQPAGRNNQAGR